jgi:hypothetical protein
MARALLIATILLIGVKVMAYILSLFKFCLIGGYLASELRSGRGDDLKKNAPARLNPIDRRLEMIAGGNSLWEKLLRTAFTAPMIITGASLLQLGLGSGDHLSLTLALGISIALCSMLVLVTAVLRRLIFGAYDWETSDVKVPTKFLSEWAVARDSGANNSLYFLILVYLSVLGFAALYLAIGAAQPSAFMQDGQSPSSLTWLYFSITTLATVGYGDIHPLSNAAKIAVTCQITTGPLLLSWLLSVFLSTRHEAD